MKYLLFLYPLFFLFSLLNAQTLSNRTGFFISSEGHILTSETGINASSRIDVIYDKKSYQARVKSSLPDLNAVILKIEPPTPTPFLTLADSSHLEPGDEIITIGFPNILESLTPRYSKGLVAQSDNPTALKITITLQSGSLGGALIDPSGAVVGMITAANNSHQIHIASRSDFIAKHLSQSTQPTPLTDSLLEKATVPILLTTQTTLAHETAILHQNPGRNQTQPSTLTSQQPKPPTQEVNYYYPEPETLEEQVGHYIKKYFRIRTQNRFDQLLKYFTPTLDNYKGKSNQPLEVLLSDLRVFNEQWPKRTFQVDRVGIVDTLANRLTIEAYYNYTFTHKTGKTAIGKDKVTLGVINSNLGFQIFSVGPAGINSKQQAAPIPVALKPEENQSTITKAIAVVAEPEPQPNPEELVQQIISKYMIDGSTGGKGASYLFADSIDYYGTRKSRYQASVDERNYNQTWPLRHYTPAGKSEIDATENGRFFVKAFSLIGASNGHAHRLVEATTGFIVNPTNGLNGSIEKVYLINTKERKVSLSEFNTFAKRSSNPPSPPQ